jgi:two-component system phosphate regulon sensor histidine kinase PhoR
VRPILKITEGAIRLASRPSASGLGRFQGYELEQLSRAINEIDAQLREKIDEVCHERDYLQTVLGGMMEGVLVVDDRARIRMVNDALRSLLGVSGAIANKTSLEVIRNVQLESSIRSALEDGKRVAFEMSIPSGHRILEVNVVGIVTTASLSESGTRRITGAIAVFHDITRLKALEKIRQDFIANVSHELRTPLTTI